MSRLPVFYEKIIAEEVNVQHVYSENDDGSITCRICPQGEHTQENAKYYE